MNVSQNTSKLSTIYRFLGCLLIGAYALGSAYCQQAFAEINIKFDFLNFPIFIGEIFLLVCLILFFLLWKHERFEIKFWHALVGVYFLWIIFKAAEGYVSYGPLALRKSALFYYPIFAIFGYYFFDRRLFNTKVNLSIIFIIIYLCAGDGGLYYHLYTLLILLVLLINQLKAIWARIVLFIVSILAYPFNDILTGSRSLVLGVASGWIFLHFTYLPFLLKKHFKRPNLVLLVIFVLILAVFLIGAKTRVRTIFLSGEFKEIYQLNESLIEQRKDKFTFQPLNPSLFSKNAAYVPKEKGNFLTSLSKEEYITYTKSKNAYVDVNVEYDSNATAVMKEAQNNVEGSGVIHEYTNQGKIEQDLIHIRSIGSELGNILFRYYIWQDMIDEMIEEKAWGGLNWGKPQRSKRLEMLDWAKQQIQIDGWICPHNSLLHMIYCGGVVGFGMVILIFCVLFKMVWRFYVMESLPGLLLSSVIVYWLVISNFLVILEFPYNAIAFWGLWGMLLAYLKIKEIKLLKKA